MKMQKTFTLKKLVLALAIAGYAMSSAHAILTPPTGTIQGAAPVLSAPSNSAVNAVDFAHTTAQVAGTLTSGDVITMTYTYNDTDGDLDDSTAHVTWYYTKAGVDTAIVGGVVNTPAATIGGTGTSALTIPAVAIGATAIRAEVTEFSASGDPISGTTINVADVSNGGGGVGPFPPPGPVVPGNNVTPGIYLSSDAAFANNLAGAATKLVVGQTYVFKLWDSANVGTVDVTPAAYSWRLVGTSATDGIVAAATGFVTSVNGANFTVPVNTAADGTALTGSADGAQGFSLAVDY